MGSSDPASYDALPAESGVGLSSASRWSRDPMTAAAIGICRAVPTPAPVRNHHRNGSYITAEVAR
jgi:hypothetical protein